MERLTGFLNPGRDASGAGFQAIAGEDRARLAAASSASASATSVQKAFYLPEAHTDMIAAVIGEELGPGRDRRRRRPLRDCSATPGCGSPSKAKDRYGKLLAAGPDLADPGPGDDQPLRGDGPGAADRRAAAVRLLRQQQPAGRRCSRSGLILNVARGGDRRALRELRVVEGGRDACRVAKGADRDAVANSASKSRGSRGGNRGARGAGAGGRRRASG